MTERWLPVPGFEGSYEVSDQGRIRSLERVVERVYKSGNTDQYPVRGRILKPHIGARGYPYVNLSLGHKRMQTWVIHRLVLAAFVGPLPDGLVTRHLNGIKTDNRLENLAYGTYSENMADTIRHGDHGGLKQTHCKRGHELSPDNCYPRQLERGRRDCIACRKIRNDMITARRREVADRSDAP